MSTNNPTSTPHASQTEALNVNHQTGTTNDSIQATVPDIPNTGFKSEGALGALRPEPSKDGTTSSVEADPAPTAAVERAEIANTQHPDPAAPSRLSAAHIKLLRDSAITDEVVQARGYRTVENEDELTNLGFGPFQARVPTLLIPLFDQDGRGTGYQSRPDVPRKKEDGKVVKYENRKGYKKVIDVPPPVAEKVRDRTYPLLLTEGVRKADAAASKGLAVLALPDVWGWNDQDHFFKSIPLDGRDAFVVFDSDSATNPHVAAAARALQSYLADRGAKVQRLVLPTGPNGEKVGLDDYFAAGHTTDELFTLTAKRPSDPTHGTEPFVVAPSYVMTEAGIFREIGTGKKAKRKKLANFTAQIKTDFVLTDGVGEERAFELEATLKGKSKRCRLTAESFAQMNWSLQQLGAGAIISPGPGVKDELRAAIQLLSEDHKSLTGYSHLGWTAHEGRDYFLHAGGAIGDESGEATAGEGANEAQPKRHSDKEFQTAGLNGRILNGTPSFEKPLCFPPEALALFELPDPPSGQALIDAIHASLEILQLGPTAVIAPLYAGLWRAPLGQTDFSLYLVGTTGSKKSETASLIQRHFGSRMDRLHLPGSFESTANYNAGVAFYAKDCVFTVDDWLLRGSLSDMERANRDADRLMRGQGNGAGRGRCSYDGTPRPVRPPRCLLLGTGEAVPEGHSLAARLFILPMGKDDINCSKLTECQRSAEQGLYAAAMAGYLKWLAARLEDTRQEIREHATSYRNEFLQEHRTLHPRTATIAGEVLGGFVAFLWFAVDVGAIDEPRSEELFEAMKSALETAVVNQKRQQREQDPVEQYLQLLGELFAGGRVHVQSLLGDRPDDNPERWGWVERTFRVPKTPTKSLPAADTTTPDSKPAVTEQGDDDQWEERTEWRPCGQHIGWINGESLYLLPGVSLAAAQDLARHMGSNLPLTLKTLGRELFHKGFIVLREEKRGVYTFRLNVNGKRPPVYHIQAYRVVAPAFGHPWDPEDGPRPTTLDDLFA